MLYLLYMFVSISQTEAKHSNTSVFRSNLLTRLQTEFVGREKTRERCVQEWVCVVCFICNIFDYLKVSVPAP